MKSNLIDEQIRQLQLKKKKIEFLSHILASAREYNHEDFRDIKDDVVSLLEDFVTTKIAVIEGIATTVKAEVATPINNGAYSTEGENKPVPLPPVQKKDPSELPPNEKMNFALEHRNLSGKKVTVANDKNMTINGTVVGLDAPNVIVKTDTGPIIKVPVTHISLS